MEIIKEYKNEREGNDCLITDYVCLVKLDYHLYTVVYTRSVYGGWTGNPITTKSESFKDYGDALNCMNVLVGKL